MADLLEEDFPLAAKDNLYRVLDKLLAHKAAPFSHLQARWKDLFGASFDVLLYDLTSTYFECEPKGSAGAWTLPSPSTKSACAPPAAAKAATFCAVTSPTPTPQSSGRCISVITQVEQASKNHGDVKYPRPCEADPAPKARLDALVFREQPMRRLVSSEDRAKSLSKYLRRAVLTSFSCSCSCSTAEVKAPGARVGASQRVGKAAYFNRLAFNRGAPDRVPTPGACRPSKAQKIFKKSFDSFGGIWD